MQTMLKGFNTLEAVIEKLLLTSTDSDRVEAIEQSSLALESVEKYHFYGRESYGRNLVFSCPSFEVILMCWQPKQGSAIHDHGHSKCIMKCLKGELEEHRFQLAAESEDDHRVVGSSVNVLRPGSVKDIDDNQGLHQITNNSMSDACSLHFYFPPIHSCNAFCQEKGSKKTVSSKFTSIYGEKC